MCKDEELIFFPWEPIELNFSLAPVFSNHETPLHKKRFFSVQVGNKIWKSKAVTGPKWALIPAANPQIMPALLTRGVGAGSVVTWPHGNLFGACASQRFLWRSLPRVLCQRRMPMGGRAQVDGNPHPSCPEGLRGTHWDGTSALAGQVAARGHRVALAHTATATPRG